MTRDAIEVELGRAAVKAGLIDERTMEALLQDERTMERALVEKAGVSPQQLTDLRLRAMLGPDADGSVPPDKPRLERYEILRELGRGGMGVVYLARDQVLGREVALKVTWIPAASDPEIERRFLNEAQVMARLRHPNIAAVHDVGRIGDHYYFSMDPIEGGSLENLLATQPDLRLVAEILEKVARAIHHVHQTKLVHRDLKPSNILLDGNMTPFVVDFGLTHSTDPSARLTKSGAVVGTPNYMSPEQAAGRIGELDHRTDIYALGAILYEAATGSAPFEGTGSVQELYQRILSAELTPPSRIRSGIPPDLERVIMMSLARERDHRYPSAEALADDLKRYLDGEPVAASRKWKTRRLVRQARRRASRLLPISLAGAGLVALAWSMVASRRIGDYEALKALARESLNSTHQMMYRAGIRYTDFRESLDRDVAALKRLSNENPGDWEIPYLLGRAAEIIGDFRGSLAWGLRSLELADMPVARVLCARSLLEQHRHLMIFSRPPPGDADPLLAGAMGHLQHVKAGADLPELAIVEAVRAYADEDYQRCLDLCGDLLERNPRIIEQVQLLAARCHIRRGAFQEAEELLNNASTNCPHFIPVYVERFQVFQLRLKWREAANDLGRLMEADPRNGSYPLSRAIIRSDHLGELEGAIEDAALATRLAGDYQAFDTYGTVLVRAAIAGDPVKAVPVLRQAVQEYTNAIRLATMAGRESRGIGYIHANRAYGRYELARRTRDPGDFASAESDCRVALDINPSEHNVINTLGQIALDQEHYEEAAKHFSQALEFVKNDPNRARTVGLRQTFLGRSLKALGRTAEALDAWRAALKAFGSMEKGEVELDPRTREARAECKEGLRTFDVSPHK